MTPSLIIAMAASAIILILSLTSPLLSPLFRCKPHSLTQSLQREGSPVEQPVSNSSPFGGFSIIIVPGHSSQALRTLVGSLLKQDYPSPFQVIVVTEKGDTDTADAIAPFTDDERLYVTHVPESSRYVSRRKLAVTLGVKAAAYEWIILTDATCQIEGDQWLRNIAQHLHPDTQLTIFNANESTDGNEKLKPEDQKPLSAFQRFRHHFVTCSIISSTVPWRTLTHMIAFRKSLFLDSQGYRDNLQFAAGEYDFLVSLFAHRQTTVVLPPSASAIVAEPLTPRQRRNNQLQYLSIRHHLRHSRAARWWFNSYATAMYLSDLAIIAGLATPLFLPQPDCWLTCSVAAVAAIAGYAIRVCIARRSATRLASHINACLVPIFERWQPIHQFRWLIRYWQSDKTDYTTHKV